MRLGFREVQKYSGEKHKKPKSDQKDQSGIEKYQIRHAKIQETNTWNVSNRKN